MKDGIAIFYILYSPSLDRYYTGITTTDIESRIQKHNASTYGRHYTSQTSDWQLRLDIPCATYAIARKMELYVKRMKSRKFIEKIINDPYQKELFIKKFRALDSPDPSGQ